MGSQKLVQSFPSLIRQWQLTLDFTISMPWKHLPGSIFENYQLFLTAASVFLGPIYAQLDLLRSIQTEAASRRSQPWHSIGIIVIQDRSRRHLSLKVQAFFFTLQLIYLFPFFSFRKLDVRWSTDLVAIYLVTNTLLLCL